MVVGGGVEVVEVEEGFRLRNLSRPRRIDLEPEAEIVASVVEAGASSVWVRGLNAAGEKVKFRVDIVSGSGSNLKKLLT